MTSGGPGDEKPPVLRVRKDAEREPEFHYSREERLARQNAPYERSTLGPMGFRAIFRKGRGWTMALLLIVLGLLFAGPLFTRATNQARLTGCDATLAVERYGDAILASISVKATGKVLEPTPVGLIEARFVAPDTGAAASTSAVMESGAALLRVRLPATGKERRIDAELTIDGRTARLSARVPASAP